MVDTTAVLAYPSALVVKAGEPIAFHLSSATLTSVDLDIVKVRCADPDPAGPGLKVTEMASAIDGAHPVSFQACRPGSFAIVADRPLLKSLQSFSVACRLWPTLPGNGAEQTIVSRWRGDKDAGWRLFLDGEGRLTLTLADARSATAESFRLSRPLLNREWVTLGFAFDAAGGHVSLFQRSRDPQAGRDVSDSLLDAPAPRRMTWPAEAPLLFAGTGDASGRPRGDFNGKIERPRLVGEARPIEALIALCDHPSPPPGDPAHLGLWDFALGMEGEAIHDRSAHGLQGETRQLPTRGMTGADFDGTATQWPVKPEHYGAIHFHDDDMADAGWTPGPGLTIPRDWPSGFYALRMRAAPASGERVESHCAFFVTADAGAPRARLAVVASTATFLAYANSALRLDQVHMESMLEGLIQISRDDAHLQEHREYGLSTYDTHNDGSGWGVSTARRPILNMRPRGNPFNYGYDTHLLDFLEHEGIAYDVIADEDIERHGAALLSGYACVVTGSHPEYYSRAMLDAFDAYQRGGGRHVYLGGNGFYWRIAWHRTLPSTIEVRREDAGTRTWEGEGGEGVHAFTGEPAGLFRAQGRAPQRLVGVGFCAQVFDRSSAYRRLPASHDPRAAFVFEGVGPDEPIGNFGLRGGGAAGIEIDRADPTLGSPPALLHLATADRIGPGGLPTPEEFRTTHRGLDGEQNARVRADMVLFPTAKGGAVFAVGSIAWVTALSHDAYRNNVARITGNVIRRFLEPESIS